MPIYLFEDVLTYLFENIPEYLSENVPKYPFGNIPKMPVRKCSECLFENVQKHLLEIVLKYLFESVPSHMFGDNIVSNSSIEHIDRMCQVEADPLQTSCCKNTLIQIWKFAHFIDLRAGLWCSPPD